MQKPKISIVLLIYSLDEDLDHMAENCFSSLKGKGDEIIVVDNGSPVPPQWALSGANKYVKLKDNVGYVRGMNYGAKMATGDYVVFVTSDTELLDGELSELCFPNCIRLPQIITDNPDYKQREDGVFYSAPNDKSLLHDEDYFFYFSDVDLFKRARKSGILVERKNNVVVYHSGWVTTTKEGKKKEMYNIDKEVFLRKWGKLPKGEK